MPDIVLVGNGPSAIDVPVGKEIDAFREVARFNNFVIDGYEKIVGTKTTIWIKNNTLSVKPRDESLFSRVIICTKPGKKITPTGNQELTPNFHEQYDTPDGKWLSTGMCGILYLLMEFDLIFLHGFDFFQKQSHHYFPSNSKNKCHMGSLERKEIDKLIKRGRIKCLRPITHL